MITRLESGRCATSLAKALGFSLLCAIIAPATAPAQSFTDISAGMQNVHHGSSLWGDYDDDGDLDALVTGETPPPLAAFADIYQNTGSGFTALTAGLAGVTGSNGISRSAWGDFDNDGDLDVVVTGLTGTPSIVNTTLYENTGSGFTPVTVTPAPLINVGLSSVAWGDYDNDGDLDLFLAGVGVPNSWVTTVYRNDGPGGGGWQFTDMSLFSTSTIPALTRVQYADGAWGDYDNDGDLDLVVTGFTINGTGALTKLYRNDGSGALVNSGASLVQVGYGSVEWGDCNNDGWLDLAITGSDGVGSNTRYCRVYINNQNGTFTQSATSFPGLHNSSTAWGDYNNDGKLDLIILGNAASNFSVTKAYKGNGNGTFTEDLNSGLTQVYEGEASFGDYDNDGRLDLIVTGRDVPTGSVYTKVYQNTTGATANTAPTVPTGLTTIATSWNSLTVQWNLSSDTQSPQAALHYNIRVEDLTAGTTVMAPMANTGSGYRHVPQLGNTNHNTEWTITGLTPGHSYSICVQAIDQAYEASAFSVCTTATTITAQPDVMIGDCLNDVGTEPNPDCGTVFWNSPNIYLRNLPDGHLPGNDVSQMPAAGPNYVYVKLKNIGNAIMPNGRVYIYFAKAATTFHWPLTWTGNGVNGDLIGSVDVSNLSGGGGSTIKFVTWNNVPNHQHFCLLARFVAASDPMTYTETDNTLDNTQNNNNIAWRNITVFSGGGFHDGVVGVANIHADAIKADLGFDVSGGEFEGNVLDHAEIKIDLGAKLYDTWVAGGRRGQGIEPVVGADGRTTTALWIRTPEARIEGLSLSPNQTLFTTVSVVYPKEFNAEVAGRRYPLNLSQYNNGHDLPVGGEYYEIEMPTRPLGKTVAPVDLGSVLKLMVHPNPTSGTTTIGYTLPADTRVTISLFDASGKLVRTLVKSAEQKQGSHRIEWDGTATDGNAVASGTYFYHVETGDGRAQGQIRVVR